MIGKLSPHCEVLSFCYEAGPCGYGVYREIADNVAQFATTGSAFLQEFVVARGHALREARQEWTRIRRWTVPALAIALVIAVPLFVVAGALGQGEFGFFDPYDDTGGWKQGVWELYGEPIQDCMLDSRRTKQVISCSIDVDYR